MPVLCFQFRRRYGRWSTGGSLTAGADALWEEIGFLAFHLHWPLDDILDLTQDVRARLIMQIQRLTRAEGR